jgi:predicted permease
MTTNLRHAYRQLVRTPGFTATAIATIALCLCANLTIFAVVDAILVRPLPFPAPDRLVTVFNAYPGAGVERASASIPNYFDRRSVIKAFSSLSIYQNCSFIVGGAGAAVRVQCARVSPEFFTTLGVPMATGRAFSENELTYSEDRVAVITDGFWRSYFGADTHVLGRTFLNDGLSITVVGVSPPGFRFPFGNAEFFRPASHDPRERQPINRHYNNWEMIGRLSSGVTVADVQAQIDAFNAHQAADDPDPGDLKPSGFHTTVAPLHADYVRLFKPTLLFLQCSGLVLLLIGAVNLTNLLLIRASSRGKDLAIRRALGAARWHIASEVVMEITALTFGGGILGVLLSFFGIRLLRSLGAEQMPLGATIAFDGRLAIVALAAMVIVGLALAAPTIWCSLHANVAATLQAATRGTTSRAAQRLRHGFIVAQVALAFVLLWGAGLLAISLKRVLDTPAGFDPNQILTGRVTLPWKKFRNAAARLAFLERLLPAISALPGVNYAAINTNLPFAGEHDDFDVTVEGFTPAPGESVQAHFIAGVIGDYWSLMSITLLRGRLLETADSHRPQAVCVVDRAFAERYWPGADPIGRRLALGAFDEQSAASVVGVVASVKQNQLTEGSGHGVVYFPYSAYASSSFLVLVRASLPPGALAPMVRKAIFQLDPELPIDDIQPMQARIDGSLVARRSPAILAGMFATAALLLTTVGTYGVIAYAVRQRRREIGVRMAIGALPQQILTQFLAQGARLLAAGIALGVIGALMAGRVLRAMLFGVGVLHLGVLAATGGLIVGTVFLAVLFPSRRAARINPIEALRSE